jgi:hypothetical protein
MQTVSISDVSELCHKNPSVKKSVARYEYGNIKHKNDDGYGKIETWYLGIRLLWEESFSD